MVKCPTAHCPGWLTVDDRRPQTVPCRYCRVTVHTLAYLLGQTAGTSARAPEDAGVDSQAPALHAAFNELMLALAGTVGGNVYLRPTDRALVAMTTSPRGVIIEYNAALAGNVGAGAIIGLLMHRLLHVELHPRTERGWRIEPKPGGRQELAWVGAYLPVVVDHAWLDPLMDQRAPGVLADMQAWGMDLALMLSGMESFFPSFLGDRTRQQIAALSATPGITAEEMRVALLDRVIDLAAIYFGRERTETNRLVLALQLADLSMRNPGAAEPFVAGLNAREALNLREATNLADRIVKGLSEARDEGPADGRLDANSFRRGLDEGLKGLNLHAAFDIRAAKAD
jgi:hypothetical protein